MNEEEKTKLSEEELQKIHDLRSFRRFMSLTTTALVLLAAIVLALRHIH